MLLAASPTANQAAPVHRGSACVRAARANGGSALPVNSHANRTRRLL